jgi:hypothetical protein
MVIQQQQLSRPNPPLLLPVDARCAFRTIKVNLHSPLLVGYFPNRDYRGLYQDITPVNSFRVVLNTLFGARFEILPDRSNYSTWAKPYQFMDVTEAVRSPFRQGPRQSGSGNSPSKP